MSRKISGLGLLATMLAANLAAQSWKGDEAVALQVQNSKGRPVVDARVVFTFQGVPGELGPDIVATDSRGRAVVGGLAPGPWQVEVAHAEYLSYIAMIDVRRGKKPLVSASFLEAGGRSLDPIKVKVTRGDKQAPSPVLEARRPPEPQPTPAPTTAEPVETASSESAAPRPRAPETVAVDRPEEAQEPHSIPPVAESPAPPEEPEAPIIEPAPVAEQQPEPPIVEPAPVAEQQPEPPIVEPAPVAEQQPEAPIVEPALAPVKKVEEPSSAPTEEAPPAPTPEPRPTPAPVPPPDEPTLEPIAQEPAPSGAPIQPTPEPPIEIPIEAGAPSTPPPTPPVEAPLPSPQEALPEPRPAVAPPPVAAVAAEPPPVNPGARVTSRSAGNCSDCSSAEWTLEVAQPVPARRPDSVGVCTSEIASAAQAAMAALSTSIQLELAAFIGPVADGSAQAAVERAEPDLISPFDDQLAPFVGGRGPCQLIGLVLPKGLRFSRVTYAASDAQGGGSCLPGQKCEIGEAEWILGARVERGPSATIVWALFENGSTERGRLATLKAYYRPPNASWQPRLPAAD